MSLFRLSNHIFELGLDAQELSVYAYLCSLPGSGNTLQGAAVISVKQRTIVLLGTSSQSFSPCLSNTMTVLRSGMSFDLTLRFRDNLAYCTR